MSLFLIGSHQNVITTKLVDGLALSHKHIKLLPLNDFPNGNMSILCMYVCTYCMHENINSTLLKMNACICVLMYYVYI